MYWHIPYANICSGWRWLFGKLREQLGTCDVVRSWLRPETTYKPPHSVSHYIRVSPYPQPQHKKVPKHFIYITWSGMQSEVVYSLKLKMPCQQYQNQHYQITRVQPHPQFPQKSNIRTCINCIYSWVHPPFVLTLKISFYSL